MQEREATVIKVVTSFYQDLYIFNFTIGPKKNGKKMEWSLIWFMVFNATVK